VHTQRLADVLLVDPNQLTVDDAAVVAVDHDGGLILERLHTGAGGGQPAPARRREAEVLVEVVTVEADDGGLQDVGRGRRPVGLAPAADLVERERGLRLRPGKAELPGEAGTEPRRGV